MFNLNLYEPLAEQCLGSAISNLLASGQFSSQTLPLRR